MLQKTSLILSFGIMVFLAGCATKHVCKNPCEGKQYKSTFYFEPSETDLDLETKEEIKQLAQNMGCGKFRVRLEGHTDISGNVEKNMLLGEQRTQAVKDFIVSLGIPQEDIEVLSYGQTQPADPDYTPQAYSKNRRVEVIFIFNGDRETSYSSPDDIYTYDNKVKETYIHPENALKAQQLLKMAQQAKLNQMNEKDAQ
jgi:hypothetical protein